MKFYKCNHIISLAVRLKLASFAAVAFSIPIFHKRRPGAPSKTVGALLRQPNDIQASEENEVDQSNQQYLHPKYLKILCQLEHQKGYENYRKM